MIIKKTHMRFKFVLLQKSFFGVFFCINFIIKCSRLKILTFFKYFNAGFNGNVIKKKNKK